MPLSIFWSRVDDVEQIEQFSVRQIRNRKWSVKRVEQRMVNHLSIPQGSESEARSEPPYMFRPVQNPDDEEVEGRVRTRTRTKELVYYTHLITFAHLTDRTCFNCDSFLFFLLCLSFFFPSFLLPVLLFYNSKSTTRYDVLLRANDGGAERAESTQTRQRQQQPGTGRQRAAKSPEIAQLGQQLFVVVFVGRA